MAETIAATVVAPAQRAKRAVSAKQLAANRRNARKSTGPRTPEGKQRSSLNALKSTGPTTAEGKAAVSLNALKHGVWARQPIGDDERDNFIAHFWRVVRNYELRPGWQRLLGIALTQTEWMLARLHLSETEMIRSNAGKPIIDQLMMFCTASGRLYRRRIRLLNWLIDGVDRDRLLRFCRRLKLTGLIPELDAVLSPVGTDGARRSQAALAGVAVKKEGTEANTGGAGQHDAQEQSEAGGKPNGMPAQDQSEANTVRPSEQMPRWPMVAAPSGKVAHGDEGQAVKQCHYEYGAEQTEPNRMA